MVVFCCDKGCRIESKFARLARGLEMNENCAFKAKRMNERMEVVENCCAWRNSAHFVLKLENVDKLGHSG